MFNGLLWKKRKEIDIWVLKINSAGGIIGQKTFERVKGDNVNG